MCDSIANGPPRCCDSNGSTIVISPLANIAGANGNVFIAGNILASNIYGTISTPYQPLITTVGILSNLVVAGRITAASLNVITANFVSNIYTTNIYGTVMTPTQPFITSLGTLTSLNVAGTSNVTSLYAAQVYGDGSGLSGLNGSNVTGVVPLAHQVVDSAQPNITSVGTLSSVNVSGVSNLTALTGSLMTAAQPNITSVGILTSLNVSGNSNVQNLWATNIYGTVSTSSQPLITSLGNLTSLTTNGLLTTANITGSNGNVSVTGNLFASNLYVANIAGVQFSQWVSNPDGNIYFMNSIGVGTNTPLANLEVVGNALITDSLTANYLYGTLKTGNQNLITNVGTLSNLVVAGNIAAGNISGNGWALANIYGSNILGPVNLSYSVINASQPNITSVGTLTGLTVQGDLSAYTLAGDGSALSNIQLANTVGILDVARSVTANAQPNITSVGTLTDLTINGVLQVPTIVSANGSAIGNLNAANLFGSVSLAESVTGNAQPNITSLGNLTSLVVTGQTRSGTFVGSGSGLSGIRASNIIGVVSAAISVTGSNQSNITSVGTLDYLNVYTGITANLYTGNASGLSNIRASNVVGVISSNVLPPSGVTPGTYGSFANVSQVTIDSYGRVTAAQNTAITSSQWTNVGSDIYLLANVAVGTSNTNLGKLTVDGNLNVISSFVAQPGLVTFADKIISSGSNVTNSNVAGFINIATGNATYLGVLNENVAVSNITSLVVTSGSNLIQANIGTSNTQTGNVSTLGVLAANIATLNTVQSYQTISNVATLNAVTVSMSTSNISNILALSANITTLNAFTSNTQTGNVSVFSALNANIAQLSTPSANITTLNGYQLFETISNIYLLNAAVVTMTSANIWNVTALSSNITTANTWTSNTAYGNVVNFTSYQSNILGLNVYTSNTSISNVSNLTTIYSNISALNVISSNTLSANVSGFESLTSNIVVLNVTSSNTATANVTSLGVLTANLATVNVFTSNTDTANVTTLEVLTANVSTLSSLDSNISTLNAFTSNTETANVTTLGVLTANINSANLVSANLVSANVSTLTSLASNISTLNVSTSNTATANVTSLGVLTANVSTSNTATANVTTLGVLTANINSANLVTSNLVSANVSTLTSIASNISTLNVSTSNTATGNVTTLGVLTANINSANLVTSNLVTANISTLTSLNANVSTLNVSTSNTATANVTTLGVLTVNINSANLITSNLVSANVSTLRSLNANVSTLNVSTSNTATANVTTLGVLTANINSANLVTSNLVSSNVSTLTSIASNISTLNVSTSNTATGNVTTLGVLTANINSGNITTANIYNANVTNTIFTTNVVAAGFTSNAANTIFNFDTFTIPYIYSTTINVASDANLLSSNLATANVSSLGVLAANVSTLNVSTSNTAIANVTTLGVLTANINSANLVTSNLVTANISTLRSLNANVSTLNVSTSNTATGNVTSLGVLTINTASANVTTLNVTSQSNLIGGIIGTLITSAQPNIGSITNLLVNNSLTTTNIWANSISVTAATNSNVAFFSNLGGLSNIFVMNQYANVGIGTTNPLARLHVTGPANVGNMLVRPFDFTVATGSGSYTNVCSIVDSPNGSGIYAIRADMMTRGAGGTAMTRTYIITCNYNATSGTWTRVVPISRPGGNNQVGLDALTTGGTTTLRATNLGAAEIVSVGIVIQVSSSSFSTVQVTDKTTETGTGATSTGYYPTTVLTEVAGLVGIYTETPGANLQVTGNIYVSNAIQGNVISPQINATNMNVTTSNIVNSNIATLTSLNSNIAVLRATTTNLVSANILTLTSLNSNITTFNVTTSTTETGNVTTLGVLTANINSANLVTANLVTANVSTLTSLSANVSTLNVSSSNTTAGNVTSLTVLNLNAATVNLFDSNLTTANISTLGVINANIAILNVTTSNTATANVTSLGVLNLNGSSVNILNSNLLTSNITSLGVLTGNVASLNVAAAYFGTANVVAGLGANTAFFNLAKIGTMNSANINSQNLAVSNALIANLIAYQANSLLINVTQEFSALSNITTLNTASLSVTGAIVPGAATGNTYLTGNIVVSGNVFSALGDPLGSGGGYYLSLPSDIAIQTPYTGALYGTTYPLSVGLSNGFTITGTSTLITVTANGNFKFSRAGAYKISAVFLSSDNVTGVALGSNVADIHGQDQGYMYRYTTFLSQNPTELIEIPLNITDASLYYYLDIFKVDAGVLHQTNDSRGGTYLTITPLQGGGLASGGPGGTPGTQWVSSGSNIYYSNSVGIGAINPQFKLDVLGTAHANSFVSDVITGRTTGYTASSNDWYIGLSSGRTVTLPAGSTCPVGKTFVIKDEASNAASNNITVSTTGGDLIDGSSTVTLALNNISVTTLWTGTRWSLI